MPSNDMWYTSNDIPSAMVQIPTVMLKVAVFVSTRIIK